MIDIVVSVPCDGCGKTVAIPVDDASKLFLKEGTRNPNRIVECVECKTWFEVMIICATSTKVFERASLVATG